MIILALGWGSHGELGRRFCLPEPLRCCSSPGPRPPLAPGPTGPRDTGPLIPWLVVAVNVVSLYLSATASGYYNRYALSFDNDCGHLVSMPQLAAFWRDLVPVHRQPVRGYLQIAVENHPQNFLWLVCVPARRRGGLA